MSSDNMLKARLIKLGKAQPSLRKHLAPILASYSDEGRGQDLEAIMGDLLIHVKRLTQFLFNEDPDNVMKERKLLRNFLFSLSEMFIALGVENEAHGYPNKYVQIGHIIRKSMMLLR